MSITNDIIVINDASKKDTSIWCNVCNYILVSLEDTRSANENSCCEECWLSFGQMRQKEWKEGWRPDSGTLNRYKQARRIINIDIKKILLGEKL
jgi:hypothetical protein